MTKQLLIEAFVVGLATLLSSYFFNLKKKTQVFLMGFIIHLLFELFGANVYYCKYGSACTKAKTV